MAALMIDSMQLKRGSSVDPGSVDGRALSEALPGGGH
jgi:hypothetical protein